MSLPAAGLNWDGPFVCAACGKYSRFLTARRHTCAKLSNKWLLPAYVVLMAI